MKLRASILDVETTGLDNRLDEVVELGIVLFEFDRFTGEVFGAVDEYCGLRDPGCPIPPGAMQAHGISDADVRGQRLDDDKVRSLLGRSTLLIAHNAKFDRGFIERLYPESRRMSWLCSMEGVPWRRKGYPSRSLQNLLRAHNFDAEAAHRALDDARNTLRLLSHSQSDGRTYLADLLAGLR
jgi:DNA polymerase-3 subunit epsilon